MANTLASSPPGIYPYRGHHRLKRKVKRANVAYPNAVFQAPTRRYRKNCPGGICDSNRWNIRCSNNLRSMLSFEVLTTFATYRKRPMRLLTLQRVIGTFQPELLTG